jgi:hypothetical protein
LGRLLCLSLATALISLLNQVHREGAYSWIRTSTSGTGDQDLLHKLPSSTLDPHILWLSARIDHETNDPLSSGCEVVVNLLGGSRSSTASQYTSSRHAKDIQHFEDYRVDGREDWNDRSYRLDRITHEQPRQSFQ